MADEVKARDTMPIQPPTSTASEVDLAEAKRREKLEAMSHSHHVAGTEPCPDEDAGRSSSSAETAIADGRKSPPPAR